uniref:Protein phosphatase Slingshot homolog 3-like n=1 Tax=Sinocyclocheilus anshuiensis TaxID=1608454 RepID=A0A671PFG7_9TELE
MDLVDAQQLCVAGPSGPEPHVKPETQVTTMLHNNFPRNIFQLERRMCKCRVQWTPVTEVWPSVFIGNEETAMDRVKLKEMGITHILNTVAYKEYLQGKIDTKAEYYQEMNITYYGVLVMDEHRFDISKDLFPASEFIHKALSNTENRLLVHCIDGVSRSATFFLAYLMIHHEMLLEDAIDHVIDKRWIRPNRDFLKQLITLNSNLVTQRKLQLRKQINTDKTKNGEEPVAQPVPEPFLLQLQDRLDECTLDCTPVTEVWPSVFIGNEETARNRAKLKGMGITHILNAAAVEKSLKISFEIPSKNSLKGKVNTGVAYYQGRSLNYYDVPAVDKCSFKVSEYFFPAAQFIHQALSNPENKVLVHCKRGISRSATLFLAYLMIHHDMMVEDAIDHVIEVRRIRPNIGFLKQLTILNSNLKSRRILQLKKDYS